MEETTTIVLQVANSKLKAFFEFLQLIDFVKVSPLLEEKDEQEKEDSFVAGSFTKEENPLKSFAGIWKDNDITLEQIREQAWQRTN
jgi:hypothetical protein